ncbi:SEL1-like repeat protein [uncultured Microscilla sp.]|uniref:SEL1-like repeat protein n=1 Tax=uncultured Microscilla sp. TaxID=432653 RepID=UPI0034570069
MNKAAILYMSIIFFSVFFNTPSIGQTSRFEKGAQTGDASDQYYLAKAYKRGDKVKQNLKKARYWYKQSSKQGFHKSMVGLGLWYYEQHKYKKALHWFRQAAHSDDFIGQYYLGLMYYRGLGVTQHKKQAQYWFDKSLKNGQLKWKVWLAKGDTLKALQWHKQKAKEGKTQCQFYLATLYEQGQGVTQDLNKAFDLYIKSLKSVNSPAYALLDSWEDIPKNVWTVFRQKAANGNPEMQYKLAELYRCAYAYERALPWFEKSALQGHAVAQTTLGTMYSLGEGTNKSYEKAFQWYKKAEARNRFAQFNLGMMYYEGNGLPIDKKQALYYFKKSAKQGVINAQMLLVYTYAVDFKNYDQAFIWCSKAAKQGNSMAQYQLALYYREGKGTEVSPKLEKYWMKKSADNGYIKAIIEIAKYKD